MKAAADCARAETLAGAIALQEAGEAERIAYRAHLAGCARCCTALGGEREIERVMSVVARAREEESWEPNIRASLVRARPGGRVWRWGGALAVAAVAIVTLRALQPQAPLVVRDIAAPAQTARISSQQEARAIAALDTQTAPRREHRAESLAFGSPATGSASFTVSLDRHGVPAKCSITRTSGYAAFDAAVCRAVMRARP